MTFVNYIFKIFLFILFIAAQKHLVPKIVSESRETNSSRSSPITQVCQSLSKLHNNAERSYNTTKNNPEMPDCMVASAGSGTDVKLVKVKQAWTASPEAATSIEVVVRRRKKSEPAGELFLHFCVFLPFWLTFGHFRRFWILGLHIYLAHLYSLT